MVEWLDTQGFGVNRKRISRLMELMGIEAVYPKPKLNQPGEGHRVYPYLLRGVGVDRVNQVWSTDITYEVARTAPAAKPVSFFGRDWGWLSLR